MLGLRFTATAMAASVALAGLGLSAPAFAKDPKNYRHRQVQVEVYGDVRSSYGNESVFPDTADHSTECINGYRWQRHNHDWFKTEAQDSLPLPCR